MLKVKPKGFLALTFLIMIGVVPLFYLASVPFPRVNSMTEGRVLKQFSLQGLGFKSALDVFQDGDKARAASMGFNLVLNRALPEQIEKATSDQFPLRDQFIQITYAFGRSLNELVYWRSPMPAIPATIAPDNEIYIMRDLKTFIYKPDTFTPEKIESINKRIANYQNLIKQFSDIDFHVYYIESIWNSPYNPLDPFVTNPDQGQSFNYFERNKPKDLHLARFSLNSFDDYLKYYYRTDGHWNIHGILLAYDGIYNLLKQSYPEISAQHHYDDFITFPDIEFIGQHGRRSIYPMKGEEFEVVDYDLGPYVVLKGGEEFTYGKSADYFKGEYSTEPFVHHYGEFFGWNETSLEFVFENGSDRDILIFGDSYDNPLLPLIASHYHHTFSVDLRTYPDFSLAAFLEDHAVDDILVIGISGVAFETTDWIINP